MNRNFLLSTTFLLGLAAVAGAQQTGGLMPNTLTNHDIVVLAQAGFNENFIADFVSMSRTRFDTSVTGLTEMAKEGLTERLIRVILSATATPAAGNTAVSGTPANTEIIPAAMFGPGMEAGGRSRTPSQTESALAISKQASYYRTSTIFWGLWTKSTAVGPGGRTGQPIGGQMGTAYGQVQAMNPMGVPVRYVLP